MNINGGKQYSAAQMVIDTLKIMELSMYLVFQVRKSTTYLMH